jgi:hypothetical protein
LISCQSYKPKQTAHTTKNEEVPQSDGQSAHRCL